MNVTIQQIEAELMKLDPKSHAFLAEKLLHSLDDLTEAENGQLWIAEAQRRHEELENRTVSSRPASEVLRDVRNALK